MFVNESAMTLPSSVSIKFSCLNIQVVLDSETVKLSGLPRVDSGGQQPQVFEVCACASGKLYLSPAAATGLSCSTNNDPICTS